jgi:hypothetical protein
MNLKLGIHIASAVMITAAAMAGVSGCSTVKKVKSMASNSLSVDPPAPEEPPVRVVITRSEVLDDNLLVEVQLQAKTEIPSKVLAVSLIGLNDGVKVSQVTRPVSEVWSQPKIESGDRVKLEFQMPASGLEEYQVVCSWGDEAKNLLAASAAPDSALPSSGFPALLLTNVVVDAESETCPSPPCALKYSIRAELVNSSAVESKTDISLALGLFWAEKGQAPAFPGDAAPLSLNEEKIKLDGVVLPPGGSQKLNVEVDRDVPVVDGGAFVPHLRILPQ